MKFSCSKSGPIGKCKSLFPLNNYRFERQKMISYANSSLKMRNLLQSGINLPRLFLHLCYSQAYAELETDTPGQIFGVTHKTDGKSSNWTSSSSSSSTRRKAAENISEKFTQGPRPDEYEEHDESASGDPPKNLLDNPKFFHILGFIIVVYIIVYLSRQFEEESMIDRRNRALADQKVRNERAKEFSDA